MEIEPDTIHTRHLTAGHRRARSWRWWASVVAIGVFLGNLGSFAAYQLYLEWELRNLVVSFEEVFTHRAEYSREKMEQLAKENAARIKRQQDAAATTAQLRETCNYWTKVIRTENTPLNRGYQRMACARVRNLPN